MKNIYLKINVLLLFLVLAGCKKETTESIEEFQDLKIFYNKHKPNENSLFKNVKPNWSSVYKAKHPDFLVYEVSLLNPDRVGIISKQLSSEDLNTYSQKHVLRLLLFVDVKSEEVVKACYMAIEGNNSVDLVNVNYKKTNGLTGQVIYYNLDGTLSNGVSYVNGAPLHKILELSTEEVLKMKQQNNRLVEIQGCSVQYIETGYVGCVGVGGYENCQWYSTGYSSYMVCGAAAEKSFLEDYSGGGGGDGGGSAGSSSSEENDPDLRSDCGSWKYTPVGPNNNYQACGISKVDLDYITTYTDSDGKLHVDYVYYKFNVPIYFEFPRIRANGTIVSSTEAATISANLRDEAEKALEERLGYKANPGGTVIENAYLEILGALMASQGGRVSRTSNYGTVPISPLRKGLSAGGC